jgi:hypothetical protein
VPLQIDLDSIRREHGQLQDMSRLKQMENVELAKQLKNAKMALVLEEGIQKNLDIAAKKAMLIMATDKVELIRKDLEHLCAPPYSVHGWPFKPNPLQPARVSSRKAMGMVRRRTS